MTRKKPAKHAGYPRPWMAPKRGESEVQRLARLMASCCHCGTHIVDPTALLAHEGSCEADGQAQGRRTDLEEK